MPRTRYWIGWVPEAKAADLAAEMRVHSWDLYSHGMHDGEYHGIISEFFVALDALSRTRKDLRTEDQKTARKVTVTVTFE